MIKLVPESLYESKNFFIDKDIEGLSGQDVYLADQKGLPKNIKERLSDEYGRKPTPKEQKEIEKSKVFYKSFKDGKNTIKAYFVDIKPIRDISFGDFVEGGNECAYPNFVPIGEIWIDKVFKLVPERALQILVHEAIERKLMQENPNRVYYKETSKLRKEGDVKKEGAHEEANKIERDLRDGKITFKEAIDEYYKPHTHES
jgi:hypothetical protein